MRLPPFGLDRPQKYVYWNGKRFYIRKNINGEKKYFGTYNTLNEALDERDKLIENGWCKE